MSVDELTKLASATNPFDAMADYLGEFLGPVDADSNELAAPGNQLPDFLTREIIQPDHWLQPVINFSKRNPSLDNLVQASAENLTILFWLFFYLRRPVGRLVRMAMMDQCQELMMEMRFYQQLQLR